MSENPSDPRRERRNLGRGLAALFGEEETTVTELGGERAARRVAVGHLRPSPVQPRRRFNEDELASLVDSVRAKGVLQPLLVRRVPGQPDQYEIIAGERRWRAAQRAQIHDVPVVVRDFSDSEALEIALVENIQRENLTPLEEAEGYRRLMDEFAHTQEELGRAVGKSRAHVANMLRLLNLPNEVKTLLDDGLLSMGHGRALLNAADATGLAHEVVRRGLNVRQTERLVASERAAPRRRKAGAGGAQPTGKDADTLALERDLSNLLGLKVTITLKGEAGEIAIHFDTLEQLDDVLHRLKRDPAAGLAAR